jgi:hypothetical protein
MKSEPSKRIVLEELRRLFDANYSASDILDGKLQNLLSFSSAIVGLAAPIIFTIPKDQRGILFLFPLTIVVGLYVFLFYVVVEGSKPAAYSFPISMNMETLRNKYLVKSESIALEQDILDHLHYIEQAVQMNKSKARAVQIATEVMFLIVIFLVLTVGVVFALP